MTNTSERLIKQHLNAARPPRSITPFLTLCSSQPWTREAAPSTPAHVTGKALAVLVVDLCSFRTPEHYIMFSIEFKPKRSL